MMNMINFNLQYLDSLSTIEDRIKYCDDTLILIGKGGNRRVYKIDDNSVIKVPISVEALRENIKEIKISKYNYPFITKVFKYNEEGNWTVSEYCYLYAFNKGSSIKLIDKIISYTKLDIFEFFLLFKFCIVIGYDHYFKWKNLFIRLFDDVLNENTELNKIFINEKNSSIRTQNYGNILKEIYNIKPRYSTRPLLRIFYALEYFFNNKEKINLNNVYDIMDSNQYKEIFFIKDVLPYYPKCKDYTSYTDTGIRNLGFVKRNNEDKMVILDC